MSIVTLHSELETLSLNPEMKNDRCEIFLEVKNLLVYYNHKVFYVHEGLNLVHKGLSPEDTIEFIKNHEY